ncbi:GNAT family N-acetyltransferase [Vibrio sp. 10N.286.49.B3]|uniref:GNAT family N-acetyltransferase n=1 Tax=Vibrio sp. 10N.286.49.B3 TaxID=1880855 RepID=UPI000C840D37|nr:GNAT family N-acetyltransferase [Vibrio sp. 10N.286.49.B3]PMH37143.1 GNAT family N-acetyltransferase [Vibrio sp. 10N.286.49.B3]
MYELSFEQLDPIKIPLIKRIYKAHYPSGKAKKDELTITASHSGVICGLVRFRPVGSYRLMTGMLVIPSYREAKVGHALMQYCCANVLSDTDYCFAYSHLENFYSQHGFSTIEIETLPNHLRDMLTRYVNSGKDLIPMHYTKQG